MRLEILSSTEVRVVLSERNLRALLAKLAGHPPDSACTLQYVTKDGVFLSVHAEPDTAHYNNPERDSPKPGELHPATEAVLE